MKNIYLFFALFSFLNSYSQTSYEKEFEEAKLYVKETFKNNPSQILNYVKLSDGKLKLCKTDNPMQEFEDSDWNMFYKIIRKDDKIIYISKSDNMWGGLGDWFSSQDFYFNRSGILLGAEKKEDFFLEETKCAQQIKYRAFYKNVNTTYLENVEKILNENEKEISLDSPKCITSKKGILESINSIDKIAFRTVEDFMKTEKIKYYRSDEYENPTSQKSVEDEKEKPIIGNLLKGRGARNGTNVSGNADSKVGVDRKLVSFIPGTMGRGGSQPKHNCSASGNVSIAYTIDKMGNVVSARRLSGIYDTCAISYSISWIKQYVKAEKSSTFSTGVYSITF